MMMRMTKIQTSSNCRCGGGVQSLAGGQEMLGRNRQQNESDERDAGHAVSLESVRGRPHRIPRIITRAIGYYAGVACVVFLNFEDDFHEVGTDVGNFGEDAAGDAQRGGAKGFADGETDETRTRIVPRDEK
jgi:hypothetical protein